MNSQDRLALAPAAQAPLPEGWDLYRVIFETSSHGLVVRDADGAIVAVNAAAERILGLTQAQLEQRDQDDCRWQAVHADGSPFAPETLPAREVLRTGLPVTQVVLGLLHPQPVPTQWLQVDSIPVFRAGGASPWRVITTLKDITERKRAEDASREVGWLYRSLFENTLNGIGYCRVLYEDGQPRDFVYLAVNGAFKAITGLDFVIGRQVSEIIPGIQELDPELFEILGRIARGGPPECFEIHLKSLSRWFQISAYSPEPDAFIAVFQVITERKLAEQALAEDLRMSEEKFSALVRFLPAGLAMTDAAGQVLYANRAMAESLRLTPVQCLQWQITAPRWDFLRADGTPMPVQALASVRALHGGETVRNQEIGMTLADGSTRWFLVSATPMPFHGLGVCIAVIDITPRKTAELALVQLNQTLEQRVEAELERRLGHERALVHQARLAAMGELVGHIGHQWRQPLNALAMVLANLQEARQGGELTDAYFAATVLHGEAMVQKMSATLSTFIDFARSERVAGRFPLRQRTLEAIALVAASLNHCGVAVQLQEGPEVWVHGHPNEFSQVLLNLLGNAREAIQGANPDAGLIQIEITREADAVQLTLTDNGGGIQALPVERVFEPYFSSKPGGTGLGLYLTRLILEQRLQASIQASNVPGGARFTLRLPLG